VFASCVPVINADALDNRGLPRQLSHFCLIRDSLQDGCIAVLPNYADPALPLKNNKILVRRPANVRGSPCIIEGEKDCRHNPSRAKPASPGMTSSFYHEKPKQLHIAARKPQRVTITISWKLRNYLQQRSDEEGRSLSNLAALLLERSIDQRE
jgi:hypothetical protein